MKGSIRQRKPSMKWEYTFDAGKKIDKNGVTKRNRISKGGFKTKKECQDALATALADFNRTDIVVKETNYSIAEFMYFYLDNYVSVKCRYNTHRLYKDAIDRYIIPRIGGHYLKTITAETLQKLFDDVYNETKSKSIINSMYCVLSKSFRFAVTKYKFLKHNSMKYVDVDYEFKKVKRDIPSKDVVYEALALLSREYRHSYFLPVVIAYHTGMRRSEILALSFDSNVVDLDKQIIYVKKQARFIDGEIHLVDLKTKASEREILISGQLTKILREHKEFLEKNGIKDKFVCRNHNLEIMNNECVSHILRLLKNKFGLNIRLHDLRHLHGSLLCEVGCNYKGIQERLRPLKFEYYDEYLC